MKVKRILVPSDFSESAEQALANAFSIAKIHNAEITLLHIVTVYEDDPYSQRQTFPDLKEYYHQLEERADDQCRKVLSSHVIKGIQVEYAIRRGFSPYEEILTFASEQNIDLIAMGTHSRKPFAHFFIGSVAENVVHHAPCPVLTVHISAGNTRIPSFEHILVPTDFSTQSKNALELALSLLPENGILHLLHVVEDNIHPAYFTEDSESILDLIPNLKERSLGMLKKMADELIPQETTTEINLLEGRIYQTIVQYAEEQAIDLIVMGTHGSSALGQILMGSQTNRVIRKASCPVVTIK